MATRRPEFNAVAANFLVARGPKAHITRRERKARQLVRPDISSLDNRPPLVDLGLVMRSERLRCLTCTRRHLETELCKPFAHRWIGQRFYHRAVEFGDH